MIDSTIVRAHRAASGAKGGSWRKVLAAHAEAARRSSMPCRRAGTTARLHADAGHSHDVLTVPELLNHPTPPLAVCADKAYDSQHVRQAIRDDRAVPVIPYRSNALDPKPYDKRLCRKRNFIERFFC